MEKSIFKEMIKTIKEQNVMTEHKKGILRDIAIILEVEKDGWKGYKIIGKNGYSFNYFNEKI